MLIKAFVFLVVCGEIRLIECIYGGDLEYFFYPKDEDEFKKIAVGKIVRTIIFDTQRKVVVNTYSRSVRKLWEQTRKNNIETDHGIKKLAGENYQIYSWVVESDGNFGLPFFTKQD